jgi:hypothetical protein
VGLAIRHDNGMGTGGLIPSPTAVTYGSAALSRLKLTTDGYYQAAELWALIAPPLGTQQVTAQFESAPQHAAMGVMSFTGAAQTGTVGDIASTASVGTTAALLVPSTGYAAVVDLLSNSTVYTLTAAPGQEELWRDGTDGVHGYSTFTPVVGSMTALSWSGANVNYVLLGAPIAEVACQ